MKISNSKERLKEMMEKLNLKPVDICKRSGIQKSSLSNYINGTREPRQDQISLICDPYGINPAWLMGYDVQMFITDSEGDSSEAITAAIELYHRYEELPPEKKAQFEAYLKFLQSKS